jgi:hypothetical protein
VTEKPREGVDPAGEVSDPALRVKEKPREVGDPARKVVNPALRVKEKPREVGDPARKLVNPALRVKEKPREVGDPARELVNPALEVTEKQRNLLDPACRADTRSRERGGTSHEVDGLSWRRGDGPRRVGELSRKRHDKPRGGGDLSSQRGDEPCRVDELSRQPCAQARRVDRAGARVRCPGQVSRRPGQLRRRLRNGVLDLDPHESSCAAHAHRTPHDGRLRAMRAAMVLRRCATLVSVLLASLVAACSAPPRGGAGETRSLPAKVTPDRFALQYAGAYAPDDPRAETALVDLLPDGTFQSIGRTPGTGGRGVWTARPADRTLPLDLRLVTASRESHLVITTYDGHALATGRSRPIALHAVGIVGPDEQVCGDTGGRWADDDVDPSTGLYCTCATGQAYVPSFGGCVESALLELDTAG